MSVRDVGLLTAFGCYPRFETPTRAIRKKSEVEE